VAFFSVATGNYRIGANASLEGSVRRVLVAPFDGYVAEALHRAGELVSAGTVLATLDQRDLTLEYYKWASQQAQYAKQYQEAAAQHDRAQSSILLAQVQQAEAQMNLLKEQLGRARIAAPFDGLVVSGDLNQSLGTSVKRGQVLFEVSPLNAYRVVLDVDEAEIGGDEYNNFVISGDTLSEAQQNLIKEITKSAVEQCACGNGGIVYA
jgi:multidrug resistance efflux pump